LEGKLDLLDNHEEWFFDKLQYRLYFRAPNDENPTKRTLEDKLLIKNPDMN
jgi:hypothetical protein